MRRLALISACLLISCGGDERPILVDLPGDPGALFIGADDEAAVATVGGWRITAEDLLAVHPVRAGASLEESLDVLVDRVVAVQAGLDGDFEPRFDLVLAWRKALARRWTLRRFTEDFTPATIPEEMLRAVWDVKWFLWDHMNTYYLLDAQSICCHAHATECAAAAVAACQDGQMDLMETLRRVFVEEGVATPHDFDRVGRDFAAKHGVEVAVMSYAFQYDHSKAYDDQKGYDLYDKAISLAVEHMEVNTFTPVIRSGQGLHIVFLYKFLAEMHKTLADPEVRAEIAQKAYPGLQEKEAAAEFTRLSEGVDIGFFPEILEQVDWSRVTGLEPR
ncbi:MAG: hypothetical protein ABIK09_09555 [Pseudomonadota bacterium]